MRSILALAALPLVLVVQEPKPDETVAKRFTRGDFVVEGLGVCAIGESEVSCWDMDGRRSPSLTEQIRAGLLGRGNNDMSFRFGKKNRYLVVRRSASQPSASYQVNGQYSNNFSFDYSSNGPVVELLRLSADSADTEATVTAMIHGLEPGRTIDLPLRVGERVQFEGSEFEVGPSEEIKVGPAPAQPNVPPRWGKQWRIYLGQGEANRYGNFNLVPVGADNKPIIYVDKKGDPVSAVEFLRAMPKPDAARNSAVNFGRWYPGMPVDPNAKYQEVRLLMNSEQTVRGATTVVSNVNPRYIRALRFSATPTRRVAITGFPLDPRG